MQATWEQALEHEKTVDQAIRYVKSSYPPAFQVSDHELRTAALDSIRRDLPNHNSDCPVGAFVWRSLVHRLRLEADRLAPMGHVDIDPLISDEFTVRSNADVAALPVTVSAEDEFFASNGAADKATQVLTWIGEHYPKTAERIRQVYLHGKTVKDVAADEGCTHQAVSESMRTAFRAARGVFA